MQTEPESFREKLTPLLRPEQADDKKEEIARLEVMLKAPPYISTAIDKRQTIHEIQRLKRDLETQEPRPYQGKEKDAALARKEELEELIRSAGTGMPTRDEQMRNCTGNVDKHLLWEEAAKAALIPEWKNICRRLQAGGDIAAPRNARDIANVEILRPQSKSREPDMADARIARKTQYYGGSQSVVLTEAEIAGLRRLLPGEADKIGLLSPSDRTYLKALLCRAGQPIDDLPYEEARNRAISLGVKTFGLKREEIIAELKAYDEREAVKPDAAA